MIKPLTSKADKVSLGVIEQTESSSTSSVAEDFVRTRTQALELCQGLNAEDMGAQSMEDASPSKWHIAHTTSFFETFILAKFGPGYRIFDSSFPYLFNSYYEAMGERHARPQRGLLTRPPLNHVMAYRRHVDQAMSELLESPLATKEIEDLVTVGLHHEMQHQELMMTDLLHLFSCNPLLPAFRSDLSPPSKNQNPFSMISFDGGLVHVGANAQASSFTYDCERPEHKTWLEPFKLASRPVTNGEWLEFISDGGIDSPCCGSRMAGVTAKTMPGRHRAIGSRLMGNGSNSGSLE